MPPSLGNLFVIMQQLVGLALEVAVVKDIHQGVLIGLAQNPVLVGLVQALGTGSLVTWAGGDGLAAAHDAATAAGHDLDQMVLLLAGADLLHDLPGIGQAGDHADVHIHAVVGNGGFLDALLAANAAGSNGIEGSGIVIRCQAAQHRLGNAAGDAEDHAAAGGQAKGHIAGLWLDLIEGNAEVLDHPGQLRGGEDDVCILLAMGKGIGAHSLHLLGGTGHDGHHEGLLALRVGGVTVILLDNGGEHALGRPAGGDIFLHLRELVVHEFHPGGAAGGQQRQLAAVVHPVQEFGGFLHDRQVGGIAGVEDLVKAHGVEGRHGLAHGVLAVGQAEGIPHRYPNCRGDLGDHPGVGVTQGGIDLVQMGADGQSACGAIHPALAAADAGGLGQLLIERGGHLRIRAPVGKAQNAYALDFRAHPHAVAAENALVGVTDDGG